MPIMQVFDRVCIHLFFMWGVRGKYVRGLLSVQAYWITQCYVNVSVLLDSIQAQREYANSKQKGPSSI